MLEVRTDKGALQELIAVLEETIRPQVISELIEQAGNIGLEESRNLVPVVSGRLRDSLSFKMQGSDTGVLSANTPYAKAVEYGSPKHVGKPYLEPGAAKAFMVLQAALENSLAKRGVGRPTTTGAGTYTPTGGQRGRPKGPESLNQYEGHKESDRSVQRKYISKRKSPSTGKMIYEYGDQPRLRTARVRKTDRRIRRTGRANRGQ